MFRQLTLRCEMGAVSVVLTAVMAQVAVAQGDYRPSPPWQATCQATEERTLHHLFRTPACEREFFDVYGVSDVATTHAWMIARRECIREWAHFAWIAYAGNDLKLSDLAWVQQLYMTRERVGEPSACNDRDCLAAEVEALLASGETAIIGEAAIRHVNGFLDDVERNTSFQETMDAAFDAASPVCLYHANIECIGAMRMALGWMYPRSYRLSREPPETITFSMLPTMRRMFSDTLTQRYASRLALRLLRAIEGGGLDAAGANFYDVAVEAFESDYDRLWDFIVVYATRGAAWATGYQLAHEDNKPLFAAMMVISSAMGYLDTRHFDEGRAWSYPATDGATCFQPKPYHFWMAGGFSYLLRRQGYSVRTSLEVARLLGAMYEVQSETMGRDPDEIFFVPTFDPVVNRARREVAHHALGSLAGIAYRAPSPVPFDATLDRLMHASQRLPAYSEAEMRERIADRLSRWQLWTRLVGFYETWRD